MGRALYQLDGATYTPDQAGENRVFAMAGRFLGVLLDEFAAEELAVQVFEAPAP